MTDGTRKHSNLFDRPGTMATLMRGFDWPASPVGPVDGWPQSLKSTLRTLLASRYPMILTWGPEFTQFYNDAYAEIIGDLHPGALGTDIRNTLAEAWGTLGPMIEEVMRSGVANWTPALLLLLNRSGYREEAYFSVSHAPAEDDSGAIVGMLAVCSEVTAQIVGERRLAFLRNLAAAGDARELDDACRRLSSVVAGHPLDMPFALVYLRDAVTGGSAGRLTLRASIGIPPGAPAVPTSFDPHVHGTDPWSLARAARGETVLVEDVQGMVECRGGPWGEPVLAAVTQPIGAARQGDPLGVLVCGISPNRALDEGYRSFLELFAGQVSITLGNALAYEAERRRADALAELDRAKTDFFSNVSHEFRTPLTLMLGPVEELLAGIGTRDAEARTQLETLRRNSLRLLKLVNSLLDFSRIEAGKAQALFEPTDLPAFTAEIAGSFRSAMESAGLRFDVRCDALEEPVAVDRDMWEKIVLNLLSNALKFTPEGSVRLVLRKAGQGVELEVADTGIGIPLDEQPRLFERFRRGNPANARTHEGSGIGLALVRELAALHGGTAEIRSEPGRGATFTVRIPLLRADRAGPLRPERAAAPTSIGADAYLAEMDRQPAGPSPAASGGQRGPGARILLVDDNADMRDYVVRLLGQEYSVATARDGLEALAATREEMPDLVLSDIMMPRLDGFGLLKALREDPGTRDMPVILLSARAGEEASVEGLDAGADDYLVKPFSSRELLARVRANLAMARLRREAAAALHEGERMRVLGQLTAGIAHDFNNLLMVLRGVLHLLTRRITDETLLGFIGRANETVDRGALMTNRLLSFARRQHLSPQPIDLNLHLGRLADVLRRTFPENIEVEMSPGEVLSVHADPGEFDAALLNIAINARDAMQDGGTLRFETACVGIDEADGQKLRAGRYGLVRIADTGAGMRPEVASRVFEPFFTTKPVGEGTGLGLAQVYGFALQSGGGVTLSSSPGAGTVVSLFLPVCEEGADKGA
jgi:signal transduction histidine kinase